MESCKGLAASKAGELTDRSSTTAGAALKLSCRCAARRGASFTTRRSRATAVGSGSGGCTTDQGPREASSTAWGKRETESVSYLEIRRDLCSPTIEPQSQGILHMCARVAVALP